MDGLCWRMVGEEFGKVGRRLGGGRMVLELGLEIVLVGFELVLQTCLELAILGT